MNSERDKFLTEAIGEKPYRRFFVSTDRQGGSGDGYYAKDGVKKRLLHLARIRQVVGVGGEARVLVKDDATIPARRFLSLYPPRPLRQRYLCLS